MGPVWAWCSGFEFGAAWLSHAIKEEGVLLSQSPTSHVSALWSDACALGLRLVPRRPAARVHGFPRGA